MIRLTVYRLLKIVSRRCGMLNLVILCRFLVRLAVFLVGR